MDKKSILQRLNVEFVGRKVNVDEIDDRIILQKIVFFLNEVGVGIGKYRFVMETYGPFSQNLNNDIHDFSSEQEMYDGELIPRMNHAISFLKEEIFDKFNAKDPYSLREWIEAIASMLYLKKYSYPSSSWDQIIQKMTSTKQYLGNESENHAAISCCESILSYKPEF